MCISHFITAYLKDKLKDQDLIKLNYCFIKDFLNCVCSDKYNDYYYNITPLPCFSLSHEQYLPSLLLHHWYKCQSKKTYVCMYRYTHTYTHTYISMYIISVF